MLPFLRIKRIHLITKTRNMKESSLCFIFWHVSTNYLKYLNSILGIEIILLWMSEDWSLGKISLALQHCGVWNIRIYRCQFLEIRLWRGMGLTWMWLICEYSAKHWCSDWRWQRTCGIPPASYKLCRDSVLEGQPKQCY